MRISFRPKALALPLLRAVNRGKLPELLLKAIYYPQFSRWQDEHGSEALHKESRHEFYEAVVIRAGLDCPIDYLEFGVFRGESLRWWCEHNLSPESTFIGFDSFEGLPESWSRDRPRGFFSTDGKPPDISDPRLRFRVGFFRETVPHFFSSFGHDNRLVVHLDADLYRSTLFVLFHLGAHLRAGDVIIFDEFSDSIHEFRAYVEFTHVFQYNFLLIAESNNFLRVALQVT